MAQYVAMSPVTLTFTITLDGVTPGGKCRAKDAALVAAAGKDAENFDAVITRFGDLLVIDRRLARSREEKKPATPVAPAPVAAKVQAKGKAKAAPAAPAPEAPAAPDLAAMMAMLQSLMAAQK
jgi:hypothetical protein